MNAESPDTLFYHGTPVSSSWELTGLLLRDFFYAADTAALSQSLTAMSNYFIQEQHVTIKEVNWREVEYDFNRLFVGPQAVLAAPYSSVYLDAETLLMGKSTQQVKELYQALGIIIANENQTPEDHISYEIEACLLLVKNNTANAHHDALCWFISEHLALWLPQFVEKIINNAVTPSIKAAAMLLTNWFGELKSRVLL
ncbi:molecular chaperone [Superficieibacter electus]|uniref:Molecular chaperone n=1 Tax=Superficieibacter electus TaxID=2022662 RepID=A0A2P5GNB5_9ENTR|nr:molecular chaperone TorD family protein [Superficieibacter electus]POP43595.1 molecular chaperone [Superficieibacter electus]POP48063.1 molecular chaperone [Superficieibacter electus]